MAELEHVDQDQLLELIEELFDISVELVDDDEHLYFVAAGDDPENSVEFPEELLDPVQRQELETHLAGLGLEL